MDISGNVILEHANVVAFFFPSNLQNLLLIKELNLANAFGGVSYLGFEKLTFVPIQVAMIV